jgi:threonine aldolase
VTLVNLYSDTQTRPTAAMREAMVAAEVGDEQSFADPTVNALLRAVAELLGFEAAVFLPSGTMCNAIAFRLHIGPGGDEACLHRRSPPIVEAGGTSTWTSTTPRAPSRRYASPAPASRELSPSQRSGRARCRIASATRWALSGGRAAARRRSLTEGPTRCSTSAARSGGAAR